VGVVSKLALLYVVVYCFRLCSRVIYLIVIAAEHILPTFKDTFTSGVVLNLHPQVCDVCFVIHCVLYAVTYGVSWCSAFSVE
jgi:hypothetical protein